MLLESFFDNYIKFNNTLNPKFWDEDQNLDSDVSKKLLEIANNYINYLNIPEEAIEDIILTGSNCNYNWTDYSDLDLHIVIDKNKLFDCDLDILDDWLDAKKKIYNTTYDIKIKDTNVELYAQDKDETHISSGSYSVLNNQWINKPKKIVPNINEPQIKKKVEYFTKRIDNLENKGCVDLEVLTHLKDKLKLMRTSGLQKFGEYSSENIAFKILRNSGYIEKLLNCLNQSISNKLSLK